MQKQSIKVVSRTENGQNLRGLEKN